MSDEEVPSGWYPDPYHRFEYRYYNGIRWTADVAVAGRRFLDPSFETPAPAARQASPSFADSSSAPGPSIGFAVTSFIVGLVAVGVAWAPIVFVFGAVAAIVGLVFGIIGIRRSRRPGGAGRGFALAGVVLSCAAFVLVPVGVVLTDKVIERIDELSSPGPHQLDVTSCSRTGPVLSAKGTLTNTDDVLHDYVVRVDFFNAATGAHLASDRTDLHSVGAGLTKPFEVSTFAAGQSDVQCHVRVSGRSIFDIN